MNSSCYYFIQSTRNDEGKRLEKSSGRREEDERNDTYLITFGCLAVNHSVNLDADRMLTTGKKGVWLRDICG
uniref:Ovule protein n=1 Tax=Caenorhabditis tropicalis TaxID=1561998 RepID=A0A1I7U8B1_9PELO